jgi:hypothetical protein
MTQQTAKRLAGLGRGPDTELVHMTQGEVKSLQQLAMAGGGSLTINPATGLPEAGFLSSMLPMLIGAGVTAATGGAAAPWMVGLGVGGLQGLRKGSLKEGLIAGFGAYGGAGLGEGLMAAGSDAIANQAVPALTSGADTAAVNQYATDFMGAKNAALTGGFTDNLTTMGKGITGLGSPGGFAGLKAGMGGGKELAMAGLAAASPMMNTTTKQPEMAPADKSMGQRYSFAQNPTNPTPTPDVSAYGDQGRNFGKELNYFNPQYTSISDAQAKSTFGFAGGGPVETMSVNNSIGTNTGYPQSDIRAGAYATPYQDPISRNVVSGAQDAAVDPYTGQATFADGGEVSGYTYDPATQTYVKAGGQGITSIKPAGYNYQDSGASGTLTPTQEAWFAEEDRTPGARDARMGQIAGYLGMVAPGRMAMQSLADLFGVSDKAVNARAMESMQNALTDDTNGARAAQAANASPATGVGNPGESEPAGPSGEGTESGGDGYARGGLSALAQGGMSHLGDYSDGGRLLRGPGDGVSDDIPATIGQKQPARLADGEFVVPARIVSELGNGSTEAGARKLYAMMERVQKARGKTVGKGKIAVNSRASKHLPA